MEATTAPEQEQAQENSTRPEETASELDRKTQAAQERAEQRETERKQPAAKREARYVVLYREKGHDDGFIVGPKVTVAGGQREARRVAVNEHDDIQQAVANGMTLELAAVPEASFQPTPVSLEQPPPKLRF